MKHDLICGWLGLPAGCWPPDHYTLLGLPPHENDRSRIEQQVHERLAKVRCYQISHPDQATEAMNRLAQAFICLCDPEAKNAYDRSSGKPADAPPRVNDDTVTNLRTRVDWQVPPPVRAETAAPASVAEPMATEPTVVAETATSAGNSEVAVPAPVPAETPKPSRAAESICAIEARRGLGTLPRLIDRIDATRTLLWTWDQIGRFLKRRTRGLRPDEEKELTKHLAAAFDLLETFPRVLGQPGKPGYRVVAIARLNATAQIFGSLDREQRKALAKDWLAARQILLSYRRFLHREFKSLRKAGWLGRAIRALRTGVHDHPVIVWTTLAATVATLLWIIFRYQ